MVQDFNSAPPLSSWGFLFLSSRGTGWHKSMWANYTFPNLYILTKLVSLAPVDPVPPAPPFTSRYGTLELAPSPPPPLGAPPPAPQSCASPFATKNPPRGGFSLLIQWRTPMLLYRAFRIHRTD